MSTLAWAAPYIRGLHHTGLYVADVADALAFYRDLLGMHVEFELARPNVRVVMLRSGSGRLELLHFTPVQTDERRAPGLRHVAYEVGDLDEAVAAFSSHGVKFLDPLPPRQDSAPRGAFFRAGDGTFIELIQVQR